MLKNESAWRIRACVSVGRAVAVIVSGVIDNDMDDDMDDIQYSNNDVWTYQRVLSTQE